MMSRDVAFGVRAATASGLDAEELTLDLGPRRKPRDEAALLLSVAAEVEHALMVQYLFAGYSVRVDQADSILRAQAKGISDRVIQLAREEMGHLITVQNLLIIIGAPLRFEREHSPFESELYPFRFKLEPLSLGSLAKYVTAESPLERPTYIDDAQWARVQEISREARRANDGRPIRHVGAIYARLISLFSDTEGGLADSDFVTSSLERQARETDWGYNPGQPRDTNRAVFVRTFQGDAVAQRRAAIEALKEIAEQGEGFGSSVDSHFERFLKLYDDLAALAEQEIVYPVATNPTVSAPPDMGSFETMDIMTAVRVANIEKGHISNTRSRRWAHLLNLRYRLLLTALAHYLSLEEQNYIETGDRIGDRTPRGFLLLLAFDAMRHIKKLSKKLMRLPLADGETDLAGPPFQLPYSLGLPEEDRSRWRTHLDVVQASLLLVRETRTGDDADDPFLIDLEASDERMIAVIDHLAAGRGIPPDLQAVDFAKVVTSLQEAVRGFKIAVHENFWTGITRDGFVVQHMFNGPIIASDPSAACAFDGRSSRLVQILNSGSMPRFRPRIPEARRDYISEWIDRQAPDNDPAGDVGVRQEREPAEEKTADAALRFSALGGAHGIDYERDIRPLFRPFDKALLKRIEGIDVDNLESMRANAAELAERFRAGTLPYDGNWSREKTGLFAEWASDVSGGG